MSTGLQAGTATERVFTWVRQRILDGTFPPGRMLSEGEVSEAVEVSRTPVREAFLRLAAEDMLELYPKRGALVVPVSTTELLEVHEARALIEPWAGRIVAGSPDRGVLVQQLRDYLAASRVALDARDFRAFQELDRAVHTAMLAAAGNELLVNFYSSLRDRQLRGGLRAAMSQPGRGEEILAQHVTIVDAIERGDGDTVATVLGTHLTRTAELLGRSIQV